MHICDANATAQLLPYGSLVQTIRAVLRAQHQGLVVAPPRMAVPLADGGTLLCMPATDGELAITKLVTVHPHNATHGLPSIHGEVIVLDARTGQRLCLLEGATVTAHRTAALSLFAAQSLAPKPDGPLLMVGAGTQAQAHLKAFAAGLNVRDVYICSRTPTHAERLAEQARALGLAAVVVDRVETVLDRVTLIVTATTSATPVLPDARPDAFIAAVGAYLPTMAELAPALVRRAQLYVDTLEGAQAEAGDLISAEVDWTAVTPLANILGSPRPTHGPVVFKSVGHALWDLAAAKVAWQQLQAPRTASSYD